MILREVLASIRHSAETLAPWRAQYRAAAQARLRWQWFYISPEELRGSSVIWHVIYC